MRQWVQFHNPVPVSVNERAVRFEAVDGWSILEAQPGRVALEREGVALTLQGAAYTLGPEVAVEATRPKGKRA